MSDSVYFHETTKTYEIPLRNLDFKYIRECNNVPELEKILKTLRSGEVGRFKELEEFCEDKLGQLDPENRLLRKAIPLGTLYQLNDQDREDVLTELQEWLSEMRQEENEACGMKYPGVEEMVSRVKERMGLKDKHEIEEEEAKVIEYDGSLPPVRRELCFKANSQSATRSSSCAADGFAGKRVIKPRDFREWDKLEKEWDKELNEESSVPQNAVTDHVNEKGEQMTLSESETRRISKLSCTDLAKRAESMPEQTRRQLATREKEKGNEAFRAGDYNEALLYYKRSLTLFPTSAVYNNRALIHLHRKEWSLAAKDCARVLREEPDNSKALFRSGRANYELHNLDEAERVLERLTDQDPTFTKAQNLLRTVRVEKSKRQTRKLQGGRRLVITDVGDSSDSSDEELPKLETVDPLSTSSIPIKCSAPSTKGPLSNQKITHTADLVSPMTSDSQLAPVVAIEPPNTDLDNTKPNHNYRVRRRVVYPPSSPGREGMVIEELSDTELEREKQQESETITTDENKAKTQAGVKVDEKETEFVTNSGDVTSSDQVNNLNYEDAKRCGAESRAKGDLEEAFRCYTHCIEVSRTDNESDRLAAAYRNRAIVALDMGRYQYVVDDCTEALNLQPGHPTSLYRRALGRRKLGDLMGAVIDLEEAHKLLPSSVNIKTALETSRRMLQSNSQHDEAFHKQPNLLDNAIPTASEFEMVNLPGAEDQTDREADQQPISVSPDPEWDIVGESCTNPSHVNETNTQNRLVDKALRDAVIQRLQVQDGKIPPITPSVFQTRWISIAKLKKVEKWKAILEIFSDIPSEALPSVIGIKLDALLLDEIIQALDWLCDTEAPSSKILDFTYKTLLYLSQVPRFYCGLLLVSDETIRAVHILLELLENHASDSQDTKWKELPQLKEKYTTGF